MVDVFHWYKWTLRFIVDFVCCSSIVELFIWIEFCHEESKRIGAEHITLFTALIHSFQLFLSANKDELWSKEIEESGEEMNKWKIEEWTNSATE